MFYKFLHHLGLVLTFLSLGGLGALALTGQAQSKARTPFVALHGTGLIIILVAGFGWLAKLGYGLPTWAIVKILVWLALGALIVPLRRQPALARPLTLIAVPSLAAVAVFIAVWHRQLFGN